MKKILKSRFFFFILGALVMGISAVFAYSYMASDIGFTPDDNNWDVENVDEALESLYSDGAIALKKICVYVNNTYSYDTSSKTSPGNKYLCNVSDNESYYFYILKEENNSVKMIMDRNYNNIVLDWQGAYNYFSSSSGIALKNAWTNVLNIEIPSSKDIIPLTNVSWQPVLYGTNWTCMGTGAKDLGQYPWCSNVAANQRMAWLFNNLATCDITGCSEGSDSSDLGYWLSEISISGQNTSELTGWYIYCRGYIESQTISYSAFGIRPVITVLKANLAY